MNRRKFIKNLGALLITAYVIPISTFTLNSSINPNLNVQWKTYYFTHDEFNKNIYNQQHKL